MKNPSARQFGRVTTTALACALVAAALPAQAAQRRVTAPSSFADDRNSGPQDDAYVVTGGQTLDILAPGVTANDNYSGFDRAVTLVSGPAHGALTLAADGSFSYTAAKGYVGMDGFRYGIGDAKQYGEANVSLSVVTASDLALTAAVSAPAVEIGSPVTFTFDILNKGAGDVVDVKLILSMPFGTSGSQATNIRPRADSRCVSGRAGAWLCSMGPIVSGATAQAALTFFPNRGGVFHIDGLVRSAQEDIDLADNTASAETMVGRLSVNPGRVVGRALWAEPNATNNNAIAELAFDNETAAAVTFEIFLSDAAPSKNDVVPGWFSVTPSNGTVDALSSQALTVLMSSANLEPGLKRGLMHFTHDSQFSVQDVPVSFTVAFRDVSAERPDDAYIHALAGANVTAGCQTGFFCPDETLSRAGSTVWLLLAREGSAYEPAAAEGLFQDVKLGRPEAPFIEELARRGVADGCDADLFCPEAPLQRADAAVMVIRMVEGVRYRPGFAQPMFRDMRDDVRAPYVDEAVRRGLFTACSAGVRTFCPNDGITRGDAAVSVVKAFNLPLY